MIRIFLFSLLFLSLFSCSDFAVSKTGTVGNKCFENGTCLNDLTCQNEICVDLTSDNKCTKGDIQWVTCPTDLEKVLKQTCNSNGEWISSDECEICHEGIERDAVCESDVSKLQKQTCDSEGHWIDKGECFDPKAVANFPEGLTFLISDKSGNYNLWKGTCENGSVIYDEQLSVFTDDERVGSFDIDEVNSRIVYSYYKEGSRIHNMRVVDFDGNIINELDNMPEGGGGSSVFSISPDGSKMIFSKGMSDQGLNQQEGYLINLDNSGLEKVFNSDAVRGVNTHKTSYQWLSNGDIVFANTKVWSDAAGEHEIYIYDGENFSAWAENTSSGEGNVVISDDLSKIAVRTMAYNVNSGIDIADWPTGSRTTLIPSGGEDACVPRQWLGDDTLLYSCGGELFFIKADGTENANVTNSSENETKINILNNTEKERVYYLR
jgi:hypothetical protein